MSTTSSTLTANQKLTETMLMVTHGNHLPAVLPSIINQVHEKRNST
ncbi:17011_t:CDS:2 [Rhizophagus irregularis]|nr:17011_t:CDS:2 [Rhizophagus irregularis]